MSIRKRYTFTMPARGDPRSRSSRFVAAAEATAASAARYGYCRHARAVWRRYSFLFAALRRKVQQHSKLPATTRRLAGALPISRHVNRLRFHCSRPLGSYEARFCLTAVFMRIYAVFIHAFFLHPDFIPPCL